MTIARLERIDFCSLENHPAAALTHTPLGTFVDGDGLTAHGKIQDWLALQPPVKMYLGWDGQIYPQYRVTEENAT